MAASPPLFDPNLKSLRRARAQSIGLVDFLQVETRDIVEERLAEVNRTFSAPVIVSPWATIWEGFARSALVSDDDVLPLQENAHDLAIHGLCLHSANDPVGQMVQLRRALRPDGVMIAAMFGGQTLQELRASLAQAESEVVGGLSPRVAPMGEIRDLGGLLQRAGFALPVADSISLNVTYETPLHLMRELRGMGEANMLAAQARGFMRRDVFARACQLYAEAYSTDDGRIKATFEIVFLTGWCPSDGQQKPLKPGSATARLADALNTTEKSTGQKPGED